ncbi:polysaccharide pyruvyl transferase family protein [Brucella tritici]|uniref:polysaccharide pyruvyl transferase family protein n=1 Tax=Brucella tritici TaxID=94626 RepID=UPI003B55EBC8
MAKYLLIGAVGGPNFGDEVILASWIKIIREFDSCSVILCDGYNSDNVAKFVDGDVYTLKPDESLWACTYSAVSEHVHDSSNSWGEIQASFYDPSRAWNAINCVEAVKRHNIDQIHIIGGGYLNELWPANYIILLLARLIAWQSGARIIATGLGLIPTRQDDVSGLVGILSTFDSVDVRDVESYDLLKRLAPGQISFSGDDALLFVNNGRVDYPLQIMDVPTLVICLQNDLFPGDAAAADLFSTSAMELLKSYGIESIIYAAAMAADVRGPSEALRCQLESNGFSISLLDPKQLTEDGFPVSIGGLTITSRYHPHLLAALSGFRGVALSATGYYDTKHQAVRNMGSKWPVLHKDDIYENILKVMEGELKKQATTFNKVVSGSFVKKKQEQARAALTELEKPAALPFQFIDIWSNNLRSLALSDEKSAGLLAQLQESQALYNNQIEANSSLESQLTGIQSQLDAALLNIAQISECLEQEKAEKNLIVNSRIWRMTAPLRWFFSRFR